MFFKFNITIIKKIGIGALDIIAAPILACCIFDKFFILSIRYFSKYVSSLLLLSEFSKDILMLIKNKIRVTTFLLSYNFLGKFIIKINKI